MVILFARSFFFAKGVTLFGQRPVVEEGGQAKKGRKKCVVLSKKISAKTEERETERHLALKDKCLNIKVFKRESKKCASKCVVGKSKKWNV